MNHNLTPTSALLFPVMEDGSVLPPPPQPNKSHDDSYLGDLKDFNFNVGSSVDLHGYPIQEPTPPSSTRNNSTSTDEHSSRVGQNVVGTSPSEVDDRAQFANAIEQRFQHVQNRSRGATTQSFQDKSEQQQVEVIENMVMEDAFNTCNPVNTYYPLEGPTTSEHQPTTQSLDLTRTATVEALSEDDLEEAKPPVKRRNRRRKPPPTEEQLAAKRESFLRRNRQAASLCREKKKSKEADLRERHSMEATRNGELKKEYNQLVEEVRVLGNAVMAAECACSTGQHCGAHGMSVR